MVKFLKRHLHCLRCHRFFGCKIKFYPSEKEIFVNFLVEDEAICLSNPVKCVRPMETFDD